MPYFVNKTDGSIITVLDGTKDTTSTSLVLFGRLVSNYGDQTNENFVRLLENFSYISSPANPVSGQLWFDRNTDNIKVYTTDNEWVTVGSVIQGNLDVSGNIHFGPYNFALKDLDGNVQITNSANVGNVSFFTNVNGVSSQVLHVNSNNGLIDVYGNAITNFGVTTKLYVDSELQALESRANTNLQSNVIIINSNLAVRISEENQLRANLTAANAQIALRDTIARVNSINTAIDAALVANVNVIYANLATRVNQTVAVETAMTANVNAANARVDGANVSITNLSNRLNSVNTAIDIALTTNLATKADTVSPTFSGIPLTTTAAVNTLSPQIASTAFVMNTLGANILPRITAVNTAMIANVAAANARVNAANVNITALDNKIDSVNSALTTAITANLSYKANLASPIFSGFPEAPTAPFGANTQQIATTEYVMTRATFWDGSRKFVSTSDPTSSLGNNGDIWFKYTP